VKNVTRHAVPTGVAVLRDVWVDVETADGERREVMNLRAKTLRDGLEVPLDHRREGDRLGRARSGSHAFRHGGPPDACGAASPRRFALTCFEALAVDGAEVTTHELVVVELPRR
jgi:hypothetical protein